MSRRSYLTYDQIRACHALYMRGHSLRQVAAQILPRTRYSSERTCAWGLLLGFRNLGLPRRDRVEAVIAANTVHGKNTRAHRDPEHRHLLAVRRGEIRDARCAGSKTGYPNKGRPCKRFAASGSDYCPSHDPARAAERAAHLAEARALRAAA